MLSNSHRTYKYQALSAGPPSKEDSCSALKISKGCLDFVHTLPETNIAPKNGWLEYYFPIGEAYFQGLLLLVSGRVFLTWGKNISKMVEQVGRMLVMQSLFGLHNTSVVVSGSPKRW